MLKISSARSQKDRISFFSLNNGATAIRSKDGEITIEYGKEIISTKGLILLLGVLVIPSIVKAFVLMPLIEKEVIGAIWYFIPSIIYIGITVLAIIALRKTGGQEFLRNHGAEHKVVTAYKKLKRVPTIEEADQFSRINKACGVTIYSAVITSQIIGFIVYKYTGYVISEIPLCLLPLLFSSHFPFNVLGKFLQIFTTLPPEKQNIELALSALSALKNVSEE